MPKDFASKDKRGAQQTLQAMRDRVTPGAPRTARLEQLAPNPRNPRYDEDDPKLAETAATFKTVGQIQPLVVVERHVFLTAYAEHAAEYEKKIGSAVWVIIIGNRRYKAAAIAAVTEVDIRVAQDITDAAAIEHAILVENLHRENLPPLLEAELLHEMVARPGASTRTVGEAIGRSHMYVQQRLDLRGLLPEFKTLFKLGELGIKTARLLAVMPPEAQQQFHAAGAPYEPLVALAPAIRTAFGSGQVDPDQARHLAGLPADEQRRIAEAGPPFHAPAVNPVYTDGQQPEAPDPAVVPDDGAVNPVYSAPDEEAGTAAATSTARDRRAQQIAIRIPERSPAKLADAIRRLLTADEVDQLITALQHE